MRRRVLGGLMAIGVLLAASACVQVPQRVTGKLPLRPAITVEGAKARVVEIGTAETKAWKSHDSSHLIHVLTGAELESTRYGIEMDKRLGRKYTEGKGETVVKESDQVLASPGGRYPAQAVVLQTFRTKKHTFRQLEILERDSAAAPWIESFASENPLGKRRLTTRAGQPRILTPLSPKKKINSLTAAMVPSLLADALQKPTSSQGKRFEHNETLNNYRISPLDKKHKKFETETVTMSPNSWSRAFPTTDGGMVVFGQLSVSYIYTAKSPQWIIPTEADSKKLLPAKGYEDMIYVNDLDFIVTVPPKGKLVLASANMTWIDLSGTVDPLAD